MRFDILTIFPHIFDSYCKEAILKRAQARRLLEICVHDLRDYTADRHKTVDDAPYGGGPGMVLKIEPIAKAVQFLSSKLSSPLRSAPGSRAKTGTVLSQVQSSKLRSKTQNFKKVKTRVILLSAKGKQFDAKMARRLSKHDRLIFICGRYEGVDERVGRYIADEEISIGPYVLNGGETAAMVVVEAVVRHLPGVLGKKESLEEKRYGVGVPVYTRPELFQWQGRRYRVPKVLLSGDHKRIEKWRQRHRAH